MNYKSIILEFFIILTITIFIGLFITHKSDVKKDNSNTSKFELEAKVINIYNNNYEKTRIEVEDINSEAKENYVLIINNDTKFIDYRKLKNKSKVDIGNYLIVTYYEQNNKVKEISKIDNIIIKDKK